MSTYFKNQIAEGETQVAKIDMEIEAYRDQINRYLDKLRVLESDKAVAEARVAAYRDALDHLAEGAEKARRKRESAPASRSLSLQWQQVLAYVAAQFPDTVSGTQLYAYCEAQEFQVREDTIRAQMAGYVNKGFAERTEPGQFRVSKEQARKAGVSEELLDYADMLYAPKRAEGSGVSAPEPSSRSGPVGRERGYPPSAPEGSIPYGSTVVQNLKAGVANVLATMPPRGRDLDDEIPF